ncbi:MAG: hypothetical protein RJA22_504 [Verrucomicrobiota bacterium]|jgi:hypothetical protein
MKHLTVVVLALPGLVFGVSRLVDLNAGSQSGTPVMTVQAREGRPASSSSAGPARLEVTRWKESEGKAGSYGMVVEQLGPKVTAQLYKLEAGEGLVIRELESAGRLMPSRQAIVFPLYNPPDVGLERWLKDGGPHVVVPWPASGDRLTATLNHPDPAKVRRVEFQRLSLPLEASGR